MTLPNLLLLVHRFPFPPNKGDKVRSFNLLKHLSKSFNIYLGTFLDDSDDEVHVEFLKSLCAEACIIRLSPKISRLKSIQGFLNNSALTLSYYKNSYLKNWVEEIIARKDIKNAVVFSSAMAQYVEYVEDLNVIIDFVDVDSEKWRIYSERKPWPLSYVYRREAEKLLAYETRIALWAARSFFVTQSEADLFLKYSPKCADKVGFIKNGVDSDYFSKNSNLVNPFRPHLTSDRPIVAVFTGAMDYWPNVDAVIWFSEKIFPEIKRRYSNFYFYIVGRDPTPAVLNLAIEGIVVTGSVDDVRPYLQYAAFIVAPLRIARGIQNKILEAMSMSQAVITGKFCANAVDAVMDREICIADAADEFIEKVFSLIEDKNLVLSIGENARKKVLNSYSWQAHLKNIDRFLVS